MTNREKINNMSNEELADLLEKHRSTDCNYCVALNLCVDFPVDNFIGCAKVIEKWLENEVEE